MVYHNDSDGNRIFRWIEIVTGVGGVIQLVVWLLGEKIFFWSGLFCFLFALFIFLYRQKRGAINWPSLPHLTDISNARISSKQASAMLSGMYSSDKVNTLENIFPRLQKNLSGEDVSLLIAGMYSSDKVAAIRILAPKIRDNLSEDEIQSILAGLFSSDREESAAILSGAGRIFNNNS